MLMRKAAAKDLDAVERIFNHILDEEEAGRLCIGWQRGVYPTRVTAQEALAADELYVLEDENGEVAASARINRIQVDAYAKAKWETDAPSDRVLVLHTLVTEPACAGKGFGTAFVRFYEKLALEMDCPYLRIDTNEKNANARRLYQKLGYREADIVPCVFNGLKGVNLVCLEKTLV